MPATRQTNISEIWKSTDNKMIETQPFNEATDTENPVPISEDDNASPPPDDDSTYNLEDDITPPNITPHQSSGSKSGSDDTGDSVEEIQTDSSGEIIPKYFFKLPSATRALNMEFNRCLLLDLDPVPSTSWMEEFNNKKNIEKEDIDTFPSADVLHTGRSSSSDETPSPPSKPPKRRKRISRISEEKVTEEDEVETDCDVKSECSSDDTCSISLDSTESDKIIPSFLFSLPQDKMISPELELCFDFCDGKSECSSGETRCSESLDSSDSDKIIPSFLFSPELERCIYFDDDSKSIDNDVLMEYTFSEKTDLYFDEDRFTRETDYTDEIKWIQSELEENKYLSKNLSVKAYSSDTALSLGSKVVVEDDEVFIPRFLFA